MQHVLHSSDPTGTGKRAVKHPAEHGQKHLPKYFQRIQFQLASEKKKKKKPEKNIFDECTQRS